MSFEAGEGEAQVSVKVILPARGCSRTGDERSTIKLGYLKNHPGEEIEGLSLSADGAGEWKGKGFLLGNGSWGWVELERAFTNLTIAREGLAKLEETFATLLGAAVDPPLDDVCEGASQNPEEAVKLLPGNRERSVVLELLHSEETRFCITSCFRSALAGVSKHAIRAVVERRLTVDADEDPDGLQEILNEWSAVSGAGASPEDQSIRNFAYGQKWGCLFHERSLFIIRPDDDTRIDDLAFKASTAMALTWAAARHLEQISRRLDEYLRKLCRPESMLVRGDRSDQEKAIKGLLEEVSGLRRSYASVLLDPSFAAFPGGTIQHLLAHARDILKVAERKRFLTDKFEIADRLLEDTLQIQALGAPTR